MSPLVLHRLWTLPGSAGPCRLGTESKAQYGGHRWLRAWQGPQPSHRPLCHTLSSVCPQRWLNKPVTPRCRLWSPVPRTARAQCPRLPLCWASGQQQQDRPQGPGEPSRRMVRPWGLGLPQGSGGHWPAQEGTVGRAVLGPPASVPSPSGGQGVGAGPLGGTARGHSLQPSTGAVSPSPQAAVPTHSS